MKPNVCFIGRQAHCQTAHCSLLQNSLKTDTCVQPAHEANDFALGTKHNLEFINILNEDGTLNHNAGPFAGQKRYDARYAVIDELTKRGLFVKKENNSMKVPLCSRSGDVIEPIIKPQCRSSSCRSSSELNVLPALLILQLRVDEHARACRRRDKGCPRRRNHHTA